MTPGVTLALSLCAALVAAAALAGWAAPGAPDVQTLSVVRHGGAPAALAPTRKPGGSLAADVDGLEAALFVPPPPSTVPPAPRTHVVGFTPAPVVHDVGPVFRGRASAIVRLPNRQLAVLLSAGAGEPRSRLLHVGELFDDRWRLAGLTMNEATLADGTSVERVPLFGEGAGASASGVAPQ
jgi:hypothetical protein